MRMPTNLKIRSWLNHQSSSNRTAAGGRNGKVKIKYKNNLKSCKQLSPSKKVAKKLLPLSAVYSSLRGNMKRCNENDQWNWENSSQRLNNCNAKVCEQIQKIKYCYYSISYWEFQIYQANTVLQRKMAHTEIKY